ncbi:hypothetical protein [Actinomadura hibisca]|uniref:hypothetical protein n=1 Tax=Actinomadura hibisca TaxID=68565 RepID=UPI00082A1EB5|nr:hypothetical protein [Actinomadura hibisca]
MTEPHDDRRSVAAASRAHDLPAIDRALRDLREAAVLVIGLAHLREPATSRPWREPAASAERRAELDYAARVELEERVDEAPGAHPDAARADVLDVLTDVLAQARDLAAWVETACHVPARPELRAADADPRPYLARAAECLPAVVTGWVNGDEVAHWAAGRAAHIVGTLSAALALRIDGQLLAAVCPWCEGRTEMAPVGGERTWRVRVLAGEPVIVCESGTCVPPPAVTGARWRGMPVWPIGSWDWLAAVLERGGPVQGVPGVPFSRRAGATGRAGTVADDGTVRALLGGLVDEEAWRLFEQQRGDGGRIAS